MEHEGSRLFAVIKTGGKQYSVAAGETITVMALAGNPGDRVTFERVLMLSQDGEPALGAPFVDGASVGGEIVEHTRGPKAIAFKKRRRKNSKRKHGHRQDLTLVRITELRTGGAKLSAEGETTGAN
jgi:large subunit ribosomal protein L21